MRAEPVDYRTDIWSLGVVIYETLTGRLPFKGESAPSVALPIQNEEPEPLTSVRSGIPLELDRIVRKALAKSTAERYQHINELLVDLRAVRNQHSGWLAAEPPWGVAPRRWAVWGWPAAPILALVMALLAAGWYWLSRSGRMAPETPSAPIPLTTYRGTERSPSFSPDGNEVAFAWDGEDQSNFDIYRKLVGPGPPLRLTSHPARDDWPAWSPDGRYIAFLREIGGYKAGIFLIPSLGGVERQLAEKDSAERGPYVYWYYYDRLAWSPDGKWLLFADRAAGERPFSLFLLSVATREKRRITFPPGTFLNGDRDASFSPNGRSVVFVRGLNWTAADLYSLSLTEQLAPQGEPRRLTFENRRTHDPIWMPDGREIIFASGDRFVLRLWRLAASGPGGLRPLVSIGTGVEHPTISIKRGRRLAYSQLVSDLDIWRIGIASLGEQATPPEKFISSTRNDYEASWSPDGKRVAFLSGRSGDQEIWVCDSDGSNPVQVTSLGGPHVGWPAWSPDSKLIAFDTAMHGQREIYVVDADGGPPQRITDDPSDEAMPSWSRDGKWIYFCSDRTGTPQVWKIRANGGKATQVTKGGGTAAFESLDGESVYYAKERGVTALWKVPAASGEESQVLDSLRHHTLFAVADRGIYFIPDGAPSIQFLDFITGDIELIASIGKPFSSLGVSPDEKWILYAGREQTGADLMLVEGFR
jgi:Tol biopolymer transport system component